MKLKFTTAVFILASLPVFSFAQANEWVTAQLAGSVGGKAVFVNGARFLTCDYKIPGTRIEFSITTTDFTCPYQVEYNMITKNWRSN